VLKVDHACMRQLFHTVVEIVARHSFLLRSWRDRIGGRPLELRSEHLHRLSLDPGPDRR
jgi:hypothetical protein